jgi:hypothetical protein
MSYIIPTGKENGLGLLSSVCGPHPCNESSFICAQKKEKKKKENE